MSKFIAYAAVEIIVGDTKSSDAYMNLATLRVEGSEAALAKLTETLTLVICAHWNAGDRNWKGTAKTASGFNATVADAGNRKELETSIRTFLETCQRHKIAFKSAGLTGQLDVGLGEGAHQICIQYIFSFPVREASTTRSRGESRRMTQELYCI